MIGYYGVGVSKTRAAHNGIKRVAHIDGFEIVDTSLGRAGKNPDHYAASYVNVALNDEPLAQVPGIVLDMLVFVT